MDHSITEKCKRQNDVTGFHFRCGRYPSARRLVYFRRPPSQVYWLTHCTRILTLYISNALTRSALSPFPWIYDFLIVTYTSSFSRLRLHATWRVTPHICQRFFWIWEIHQRDTISIHSLEIINFLYWFFKGANLSVNNIRPRLSLPTYKNEYLINKQTY